MPGIMAPGAKQPATGMRLPYLLISRTAVPFGSTASEESYPIRECDRAVLRARLV